MIVRPTRLPGVLTLAPDVHSDERGYFFESWNASEFRDATGVDASFVQDNHSRSAKGVLRGLHYQLPYPQDKLLRCTAGVIWDVAVDLRRSSPTFARWSGLELSAVNQLQIWVPAGFAHGYVALTEGAEVQYKTTQHFHAESARVIAWDDPQIGVEWPLDGPPSLSEKDADASPLAGAVLFD